ncbi:sigma-70 family RNA polymerase sigma factor [Methylomonas sp. LL1]|uniref:sigma-70 family RNA polymerase sigma factor n=1 Tax=Methylomonas sp. LL1 TaxID=2785785 RepID=UPI0018C43F54|nr:sigma-70 family RNA polymerase sigma factor [Methylomonas sp. LL1]QPK65200.1 sigma-70 family RNA polymerase sigma factor [Methylomonas sp. LL1]
MSKPNTPLHSGPIQLNLINSTRLQTLRNQSSGAGQDPHRQSAFKNVGHPDHEEDAQTARLRQRIDQRVIEILSQLPAGKQRSLFKLRFGLELDELKQLPIRQAAEILKIKPDRP